MVTMTDIDKLNRAAYASAIRVAKRRGEDGDEWHAVLVHLSARIRLGIGASIKTSIKRAGGYIPLIEESARSQATSIVHAYLTLKTNDPRLNNPVGFRLDIPPALDDKIRQRIMSWVSENPLEKDQKST